MYNARSRLLSGLAGATLFLFAATSYGQSPNTPTATPGTGSVSTQTTPAPTGTATDAATQPTTTDAATTNATVTTGTATLTTTRSFPGGTLGMVVVAVVVLLLLFSLFRGRDKTVVRETYASSSTTAPGTRNVSTGTATEDRMNLNSRAASGPDDTSGGNSDPNVRR